MRTLLKHELKQNMMSLLIWSLAVGGIGFMCICLFESMTADMASLSESFSNMGAFSDAFGMSTLGIGTIAGYFATEVGAVHSLGSSMYAAITTTTILSKEEDGHTGEFLYALPISRAKAVTAKLLAALIVILLFTVVTGGCYYIGFLVIEDHPEVELFLRFMLSQMLMNVEIAMICLVVSAFVRRNIYGAGLGIALACYAFDLTGRVIPDLKDLLVVGPFGYANASDIFAEKAIEPLAVIIGVCVILSAAVITYTKYTRKDLAA